MILLRGDLPANPEKKSIRSHRSLDVGRPLVLITQTPAPWRKSRAHPPSTWS